MGDMPQQPTPSALPARRTTHSGPLPDPFNPRPITQVEDTPFFEQARNLNVNHLDRTLAYFGLGRLAIQPRKAYVVLLWSIIWSIAQITVIVTLVALSGTVFKDPTGQSSEWSACDRPLGVWACLWIVRAIVSTALSYWEYLRELEAMEHFISGAPVLIRRGNRTSTIPRSNEQRRHQPIRQQGIVVPFANAAYTRLSVLSSLITLSWFLTAHILEYTSINTCRETSPHLWWLVFGILCIMYLMVFEVVIIGFIVLVITPIVFVFWNILLICLGRHPIQNPHIIKPDIEKIPKALVEKIPLVMYIPPPPEGSDLKPTSPKIISNPHTYPPGAVTKPVTKPKPRFRFLKSRSKAKGIATAPGKLPPDVEKASGSGQPMTWSDYWEDSDYPFVVLEGNRAACAICLMDFEEPKRKPGLEHPLSPEKEPMTEPVVPEPTVVEAERTPESDQPTQEEQKKASTDGPVEETQDASNTGITLEARGTGSGGLQLEDAGIEAQPLRLLTCGHVFHKTCLDPWLTDVSGRCPVCQRPVEIPGQRPKKPRDRIPISTTGP